MARVAYAHWTEWEASLGRTVAAWGRENPTGSVCDVGGGANPVMPEQDRAGRRYTVVDVSAEELEKCPANVERVHADVAAAGFSPIGTFDLVVSHTVAEHVGDPVAFHRNVRSLLRPGGRVVHSFPTLWTLPFVANRILPERLTQRALLRGQPWRAEGGDHEKFPARYHWCRGPSARQIARLERTGFEIERYTGYFGHGYYDWMGWVHGLEERKTRALLRRPVAALTSYAIVVARAR